jgi:hypothetical protein
MKTMDTIEANCFSVEEFGHIKLGNGKRKNRLLSMVEQLSQRASGKVTEAFENSADRQGAYKFLRNDLIKAAAIGNASHQACARRCAQESYVYICADGSSLSITDDDGGKNLGPVGPKGGGTGVEAMTAIAVHENGTPVGICGQVYWTRKKDQRIKSTRRNRSLEEKETYNWLKVIEQTEEVFAQEGGKCQRWYQCDRGADFREMLVWAQDTQALVTVRASQNRRINDKEARLLWDKMQFQPSLGTFELEITGRPKRKARIANMEIRASQISILLTNVQTKEKSNA